MRIRNDSTRSLARSFSLSSRVRRFQTAARDLCARRFSRRHLTLCRWVFCLCSWCCFFFVSFKKKSWRNCAVFRDALYVRLIGFYRDLCSFIIRYSVNSIYNYLFRRLNVELKAKLNERKLKRNGNFISGPSCAKKKTIHCLLLNCTRFAWFFFFNGHWATICVFLFVDTKSSCSQRMGEMWMNWSWSVELKINCVRFGLCDCVKICKSAR